jgi:hypothetical protein
MNMKMKRSSSVYAPNFAFIKPLEIIGEEEENLEYN